MKRALQAGEWERAVAVGALRRHGARLWLRSPGGGPHRLTFVRDGTAEPPMEVRFEVPPRPQADHTWAFEYPDECDGAPPLEPGTAYRFRIAREDGELVGEGRFETLPREGTRPRRVCIGVASCHQPFDEDGRVHPKAVQMLRAAREAWRSSGVNFVLWVGDQFYSDYPQTQSLFDPAVFRAYGPSGRPDLFSCTGDEVRRVYHERYREFWALPEWRALQAEFPGWVMLDDHEVADNFGSRPVHHTPQWAGIRQGAGAAWRDYQFSRVGESPADHDGPYDFDFEFGPVAVFGLDVRSMRRSDGHDVRVFHGDQLDRLSSWLTKHANSAALFIVSSVPFFFMPAWAAWLARHIPSQFREDAHDRWAHPDFHGDRVKVLEIVREHQLRHPSQRVTLVCGDVHVGYVTCCDWGGDPPALLHQFTSSPITHEQETGDWMFEKHIPRLHFLLGGVGDRVARVHMMGKRTSRLKQPIAGLNVGVIEVDLSRPIAELAFKLFGVDEDSPGFSKLLFEVSTAD